MKLTRVPAGYTITEVMIVLAVSGALFVSAMLLMGGQQARTEFTQSARELESQIQDVMNDVSTGYYTKNINLRCAAGLEGGVLRPQITTNATNTQGANQDCIYLGRALQFTNNTAYIKHSLVGLRRYTASGVTKESTNIVQAQLRTIARASVADTTPDGTERLRLPGGLLVRWVRYNDGSVRNVSSLAFIGELASYKAGTNLLQSQATKSINIVPVQGSSLTQTDQQAAARINDMINNVDADNQPLARNPAGGIVICLDNGNVRHALITVGGEDRPLGTQLIINSGGCPA